MIGKRIQQFTPTETNTILGNVGLGELIPMTALLKSLKLWYILEKTQEIVTILIKKTARKINDQFSFSLVYYTYLLQFQKTRLRRNVCTNVLNSISVFVANALKG